MANMMSSAVPIAVPNIPAPLRTDHEEEVLADVIQRIGFVAACIDLHDWRTVIDEVLSEVEAEQEAGPSGILDLSIEQQVGPASESSAARPRPAP
jgi:hypothetical protein